MSFLFFFSENFIKIVSISRICNRNGDGLSSSIRRFLYKTLRFFLSKNNHTQHSVASFYNYEGD